MPLFTRYTAGKDQISASDLNRRADAIEALLDQAGPNTFVSGGRVLHRRPPPATDRNVAIFIEGDGGYGGALYAGVILGPPLGGGDLDLNATSFAFAELADDNVRVECVVANIAETGQLAATHWLTDPGNIAPMYHLGRIMKYQSDGTPVVAINAWPVHSLTVITADQVSGVTLQNKPIAVSVVGVGPDNGWFTWHTGTECT